MAFTRTSTTTGEPRTLETVIWSPAVGGESALGASGEAFPLLIFSHGSCGFPENSEFLTAHLASLGFVVAAPAHPGNTIGDPDCAGTLALAESFFNRVDDVVFVVDEMLASSAFAGMIDASRIGVLGHSFGGQTALRVAADEPRVRAALALAPASSNVIVDELGRIDVPVMIQGGELDSFAPFDVDARPAFDLLRPPRYLVEILDAGHFAFTDLCPPVFFDVLVPECQGGLLSQARAHELVVRFAVAFLSRFVLGEPRLDSLLDPSNAPPEVRVVADPG